MRRAKAHTQYGDYEVSITADTIHEDEDTGPKWSGLYDQHGRKLYHKVDKVPFGFHVR